MARKLSDTRVVTGNVRLSYAHLFEAYSAHEGQEKKYSVSLLIPKSDKMTVKLINEAVEKAIQNGISSKWGGKRPKNLKLPLRDGDTERDDDIYQNHYFINANNRRQPGLSINTKIKSLILMKYTAAVTHWQVLHYILITLTEMSVSDAALIIS